MVDVQSASGAPSTAAMRGDLINSIAEVGFVAPELRIVPEPLAQAVQKRVEHMARLYMRGPKGHLQGRPNGGVPSRYLLSGLMRCEECGSSMIVSSYQSGSGRGTRQVHCYICNFSDNLKPAP